jgi:hypothetical protein
MSGTQLPPNFLESVTGKLAHAVQTEIESRVLPRKK